MQRRGYRFPQWGTTSGRRYPSVGPSWRAHHNRMYSFQAASPISASLSFLLSSQTWLHLHRRQDRWAMVRLHSSHWNVHTILRDPASAPGKDKRNKQASQHRSSRGINAGEKSVPTMIKGITSCPAHPHPTYRSSHSPCSTFVSDRKIQSNPTGRTEHGLCHKS